MVSGKENDMIPQENPKGFQRKTEEGSTEKDPTRRQENCWLKKKKVVFFHILQPIYISVQYRFTVGGSIYLSVCLSYFKKVKTFIRLMLQYISVNNVSMFHLLGV